MNKDFCLGMKITNQSHLFHGIQFLGKNGSLQILILNYTLVKLVRQTTIQKNEMIKKMNYAMKKLLVFLFHLQLVHFFSCNEKGGNQSKHLTSEEDSLIVRAFVPPISLSPNNADSISRLFEEEILLDPLDQGFDSLQIRITFAYSSGNLQKDSQKILIIKRTK